MVSREPSVSVEVEHIHGKCFRRSVAGSCGIQGVMLGYTEP